MTTLAAAAHPLTAQVYSVSAILDAMHKAGSMVTINNTDDLISAPGLPVVYRNAIRSMRQNTYETYLELILALWQMSKPRCQVPEDIHRCPACPNRGQGALYELFGEKVMCDGKCIPQERKVMP